MSKRYPSLPKIWLITDARNDDVLEAAIKRLPRGSGLIFRHYHLPANERRERFMILARLLRARNGVVVLSGPVAQARRWGADGAYGPASLLARGGKALRLVTAHSLREIGRSGNADAIMLSPVFPTRSHPYANTLGSIRFLQLATQARVPMIALGGMDTHRARALRGVNWAGIDAFCDKATRWIPKDS